LSSSCCFTLLIEAAIYRDRGGGVCIAASDGKTQWGSW
jgi:hypothetical protein